MHELSLAAGVLHMVEAAATRERFARVATLELEVGVIASVDVHALRFALEVIAPGTLLEGADVRIARPEGRAFCSDCAAEVAVAALGVACPHCGGYRLQWTQGQELRLVRLTVHDR